MTRLVGGHAVYGQAMGVLMLDTVFPRPPGDIGNALTWPFPVRYRVVRGATAERALGRRDEALLAEFVVAARELEADGIPLITTSCGFLAIYQRELAGAVSVPVLTSSLLQVPLASAVVGPGRSVGILTMSARDLTDAHFAGVGWSREAVKVEVAGFAPGSAFWDTYHDGATEVDSDVLSEELIVLGRGLVSSHPEVAAIVLECTNFAPYAGALRADLGLPVFDINSLVLLANGAR